jgi:hypothetical protein
MPYRDVKVYDDPFPTHDQIMSGDPTAPPFPKEVWLQKVNPGEFAVRYRDFKTGLASNPQGKHVQASEICRIFDNRAEARSNSLQVSKEHWTVRCFIYDHTGAQIDSVSNAKETGKFAANMYAAILLWVGIFTVVGMALIWGIYRVTLFLLAPPIRSLNWLGWFAFATAGLVIAALAWWTKLRRTASRRVNRVQASLSKEEMKKLEKLNTLFGTSDPAEREHFFALKREYEQKIKAAMHNQESQLAKKG